MDNIEVSFDLVELHAEKTVKNSQPRSRLNRLIVTNTMGAWERFLADVWVAATVDRWTGPGMSRSYVTAATGKGSRDKWKQVFGVDPATFWSAEVAVGWNGRKPIKIHRVQKKSAGKYGLTITQCIDQWMELRNGLVHHCVPQRLSAAEASVWRPGDSQAGRNSQTRSKRRDPYRTGPASGPREPLVIWRSSTIAGTSVQHGAARCCLALMTQLVDQLLGSVELAPALPDEWWCPDFQTTVFGYRFDRPPR